MSVSAIVAAGGRGVRLGSDRPKQFIDLGGRTMIEMSVEALLACPDVSEVVVAVPPEMAAEGSAVLFPRMSRTRPSTPIVVAPGGERRQDSVASAFARIAPSASIVVIHDAARPFVSANLIARTIQAARAHGAAVAAVPVVDTVKQAGPRGDGAGRVVRATLPRDAIFLAQTPQAFQRDILAQALASSQDLSVTDEATLVERAGFDVHIVEGEAANIKVTTKEDLREARARIDGAAGAGVMRIGTGYDLHRLVEGRPLVLAGVTIPFERGLLGHSDADIVCHAVADAILGAANAGDIGRLFPDTDPCWKDADSLQLLRGAVGTIQTAGYTIGNVDVTVIAERPKLLPYLDAMRANLAGALGVDATAVSVKGKTNEQVDATGRGEAMACQAVALLIRL